MKGHDVSSTRRDAVDTTSDIPSWSFVQAEFLEPVERIRRVGLYEGLDRFGRLQPLLGGEQEENVVETFTWSEPTTETPELNSLEEWVIFNFSGDAVSDLPFLSSIGRWILPLF